MIVESADEARVRELARPYEMVGTVEIYAASSCARVISAGGCVASPPPSEGVPALDPAEAAQRAMDAGMLVHRCHPLNCETSIPALIGGVVMPNATFYVRNHFHMPVLDPETWRLEVRGHVERPLKLSLRDLASR